MDFEKVTPDDIILGGKKVLKSPSFKSFSLLIAGVLILSFLSSVFYTIGPEEVGVVRRFGKFIKITESGLHVKLPFRIEKVDKVKVERKLREEFGYRTISPGVRTQYSQRSYDSESLMLTGDLNVIEFEWAVQYKVKDPVKFLFNIRDQRKTLRDVSESVARGILGDYSFDEALNKREEIGTLIGKRMQDILDIYGSGIQIVTVQLQDVNPPEPVQPAFNEVNEAEQEMKRMRNEAEQVYNQKIPQAKGEALKIVRKAEGYAQEVVNRARGDAERFKLVVSAYKKAKDVTRKRIYLDKLKEIIKQAGKIYIVDPKEKGILPLLKLEKNEE